MVQVPCSCRGEVIRFHYRGMGEMMQVPIVARENDQSCVVLDHAII